IGIGTVSFILIFIRLFAALYAYLFMDDRYPADKMIAFGTAFIALGFYSYGGIENNWLGITLALISCLAFTADIIGQKKLASSGLKPETLVLWRYATLSVLFTSIFIALQAFNVLPAEMTQMPSLSILSLIVISSLLGSVGAGVFVMYGLKTVNISTFESLNATKPVLLSLIGVGFLDETMTINQIGWGVVIILSSLYFMKPNKKKEQAS
ncbi:MAG: EamA family transporter, partial [Pseudomonadota bacterium]